MHPYHNLFAVRAEDDDLEAIGLLARALRAGSDRALLHFGAETWSVSRIAALATSMQVGLRERGVRRDDRIAVMLHNDPRHVALIYACLLSGIVWVPINTRLKSPGIAYLVDHARPVLYVTDATSAADAKAGLRDATHRCSLAMVSDIVGDGHGATLAFQPCAPGAMIAVLYTSGTTGSPKGVCFTNRMLRIAAEAALRVSEAGAGDRLLLWEPLCHIGGAQILLVPFLSPVELFLVDGFSTGQFWNQVAWAQATHVHYLGGILDRLVQLPPSATPRGHTVKVAWGAGASGARWEQYRRQLGIARLRECYGMTETASFATLNESGKPGAIGGALPWLEIELVDANDRRVRPGEIGEIVLTSRVEGAIFSGYLDDPEATRHVLRNGRLYTGDVARADADGDLFFLGRATDSMRVRGENVSAWEIERIFATHPAIAAVAAVGVPSDLGEQDILLHVQFRPGEAAGFPSLAHWAADLLASYQQPRYYLRADAFETTASQRIRKFMLTRDVSCAWDRFAPDRERREGAAQC